jgi:uncharacterized protein YbjQ (UPF0145 family)
MVVATAARGRQVRWLAEALVGQMPEPVQLYVSPWVKATRATKYFGPVICTIFVDTAGGFKEAWDKAYHDVQEGLRAKGAAIGANAVVGVEITIDLWAHEDGSEGIWAEAIGTAAVLERTW